MKEKKDSSWDKLLSFFSKHPWCTLLIIVGGGVFILILNQFAFYIGKFLPISIFIEYGDAINFWGNIISLLGTLFLGIIAFRQNQELIKINNDLQKTQLLQIEELIPFFEIIDFNIKQRESSLESINELLLEHDLGGEDKFSKEFEISFKNSCKSKINSFMLTSKIDLAPNIRISNENGLNTQKNFDSEILLPKESILIKIKIVLDKKLRNIFDNQTMSLLFTFQFRTLTGFDSKEVIYIDLNKGMKSIIYKTSNGFNDRKIEPVSVKIRI